jgi:hypothetical protein
MVFICHAEERSGKESHGTVKFRFLATLRMIIGGDYI